MARLLFVVIVLAVIAAVCFGLYRAFNFLLKRSRQRHMARYAPYLLRYESLDPQIADILVNQRKSLETGIDIVSRILQDPVISLPTEYTDPLEEWIMSNRKELQ